MQNNNSKLNTVLLIVLIIAVVAGIVVLLVTRGQKIETSEIPVVQPEDEVGQVPPGFQYEVPTGPFLDTESYVPPFVFAPLTTQYISFQELPKVTTLSAPLASCTAYTDKDGRQVSAQEQVLKGLKFCVQTTGDAAMSHQYTTKIYTTGTTQVRFTVVTVSCRVYDDPKYSECEDERNHFSIEDIMLKAMK